MGTIDTTTLCTYDNDETNLPNQKPGPHYVLGQVSRRLAVAMNHHLTLDQRSC